MSADLDSARFIIDGTTGAILGIEAGGAKAYFVTAPGGDGGSGSAGIPQMWGPFTASGVVKGVAGDPGMAMAILCTASASGNITLRNSATVGGGVIPSPLASAVTMSANQLLQLGTVDCPNGIVLDLNSGTGTFYVIGV